MTDAQWLADFTAPDNPHHAALTSAIARGDHAAIRDLYALKDGTTPWELSPASLCRLAGKTGLRVVIEQGCASPDFAVQSLCLTLRDMLQGGAVPLDLTDPDITAANGALDQLVGALPVTPEQRAGVRLAILAAGSVPTSRADRLGGYPTALTLDDIARILRGA